MQRKSLVVFLRVTTFSIILSLALFPYFNYKNEEFKIIKILTKIIFFSGIFSLLFALLTILTKGYVHENIDTKLNIPEDHVKKCYFCLINKPERSHHCKKCRKCVYKMDHHCNILCVCINYFNHGHFLRFLFFLFILLLNLIICNFICIFNSIFFNQIKYTYKNSIIISTVTITCFFLIIAVSYHLFRQIKYISKNITNVEYVQAKNNSIDFLDSSPYNISVLENFEDVLGPAKYLFFYKPAGNGYEFKKKYNCLYWPLKSNDNNYSIKMFENI